MEQETKLDPQYIIGIPGVDLQHNDLIQKCDELLDHLEKEKSSNDFILTSIQNIIEELRAHFDTEQVLMDMIDFPGKDKHKSGHDELLGILIKRPELFMKRTIDEIKNIISAFRDSYLAHILDFDRGYAIHIENLMNIKQKHSITVLKAQSIVK